MSDLLDVKRGAFKLWRGLVTIVFAQIVLLGIMFVGTSIWSRHIAQEQQRTVLCPLVLLYEDVLNKAPAGPDTDASKAVILGMHAQLHCQKVIPSVNSTS